MKRLDIVKLGPTAQEAHTVLSDEIGGTVFVKQCTTGVVRRVRVDRCIVIGHHSEDQS